MTEHDPLERFARAAGKDLAVPDFDTLVATSKRRRRASLLGSGVALAAVIGAVTLGVQAVNTDSSAPAGPAHTPTTTLPGTPSSPVTRAASIVDSALARPFSAAVLPDRPEARALVWSGPGIGTALAVTADGFRTRATLLLHGGVSEVTPAGPDWFFLAQPGLDELISPQGVRRTVRVDRTPGPVQLGECLVRTARPRE